MIPVDKITEIFFFVDEFYKNFESVIRDHILPADTSKKQRNRQFTLSDSEIMTILIIFHLGSFRNLKHYYLFYVKEHLKKEFPNTVSYNRLLNYSKRLSFL